MMTNCGCREISHEPIEFEIQKRPQVYVNCGPLLPNDNEPDLCELQSKVICDFKDVIKQLECGKKPDIENILEQISLIFMKGCGYNVAKKMYSTDLEEDYFLRHNNFLSEFETQEEKDQVLLNLGIYDKVNALLTRDDVQEMLDSEIDVISSDVNDMRNSLEKKFGFVWTDPNTAICYAFSDISSFEKWYSLENRSEDSPRILGKWRLGSSSGDSSSTGYQITYYKVSNIAYSPSNDSIDSFQSTANNTFKFSISNTYFYVLVSGLLSKIETGNNETLYDELQPSDINYVKQIGTTVINTKTYKIYEFHSSSEFTGIINVTVR